MLHYISRRLTVVSVLRASAAPRVELRPRHDEVSVCACKTGVLYELLVFSSGRRDGNEACSSVPLEKWTDVATVFFPNQHPFRPASGSTSVKARGGNATSRA
jgi:hypothetical protein